MQSLTPFMHARAKAFACIWASLFHRSSLTRTKARGRRKGIWPSSVAVGLAKQQRVLLTGLQQRRHLPKASCPGLDISTVRQVSTAHVTQRNASLSMWVTACVHTFASACECAFLSLCVRNMQVNVHARIPATNKSINPGVNSEEELTHELDYKNIGLLA